MLTGPKMYWQDEPIIGDHFGVISQSDLSDNADLTGEVIMWDRRLRKTTVVGKTIGDALNRIDQ